MKPVDIVLTTYNRLDLTRACVESVLERTSVPFRLIIVDDGSTDGTWEYLTELQDADQRVVAFTQDHQGYLATANRGWRIALERDGDYLVTLNNDVVVPHGWLRTLLAPMELDQKVAAVGPLSTARSQWQFAGRISELVKRTLPAPQAGYLTAGVSMLAFFCCLLRKSAVREVGLQDERFYPGPGGDDDYCFRLRAHGWKLALSLETLVEHVHGATMRELHDPRGLSGFEKLREKWGKRVWVSVLNQGDMRAELVNLLLRMSHERLHTVRFEYPRDRPIANNRNLIAKRFLESDYDYLLMIDSDVVPPRDPLDLVVLDKDIIGLPCFVWNSKVSRDHPLYLVVMEHIPGKGFRPLPMDPQAGLTCKSKDGRPIDAVGTGAILIARRVLEEVKAPFERRFDQDGVQTMGLDYSFCLKARQAGFTVWTHMDYVCSHWVTVDLKDIARLVR